MLRFDVAQVWSNVARWEAFVTCAVCALALVFSPWLMLIPAVQGGVRGFLAPDRLPSHRLWTRLFEAHGWGGRKENAGPKMFANKVLLVASAAAVVLFASGSALWRVPCIALLAFSLLEWAFSFCAACWAYTAWHQAAR